MKIFIGSSSENLDDLDELAGIIESLGHTPLPWNKPGLFYAGSYILERLIDIAKNEVDASIMLFSPDDKIWYRDSEMHFQPRDNVIYELGLFSGILGKDETIVLVSGDKNTKIPTDFDGIKYIDFNKKNLAKLELTGWLKHIGTKLKLKTKPENQEFIDFLKSQEDMKLTVFEIISDLYCNTGLEEYSSKEFAIYVLSTFIVDFIGFNDARFTLRAYNPDTDAMETVISTRQDAIPGPIPLSSANLISESAKQGKPLIYSENKEHHYTSSNKSIDNGVYHDYVSYCLIETEDNLPRISVCLDVKHPTAVNRLKVMVHSLIFEIICRPLIEKILNDIEREEK